MHKIDSTGTSASLPTPGAVGATVGYFTEGDPNTATPATVVSADWLNAVQEELVGVIEGLGITLDKTSQSQLLAALKRLSGQGDITNKATADSPYTMALGAQQLVVDTTSGNATVNLPTAASVIGRRFTVIKSVAANAIDVTPNGTDTINGVNAAESITDRWAVLELLSIASGKWVIL